MAYFRSIFDSPDLVRSALSEPEVWDDTDPGLRIDIDEPTGGPTVIRVRGDVDVVTAPVLRACLGEAVLTGRGVVVDLLHVPFLGCAGLAALTDAATQLSEQRCRLTVAAPTALHSEVDRLGLSAAVPCFDTVADAFHAAFAHPPSPTDPEPTFPILDRSRSSPCSPLPPPYPSLPSLQDSTGKAPPDDEPVSALHSAVGMVHRVDQAPPRSHGAR